MTSVRISPDGSTVASDRAEEYSGKRDIWLHDLARHTDTRFTIGNGVNTSPVWSGDGTRIAFSSSLDGARYVKASVTG
jgi:Tol biopolymer transport system component